MKGVVVIPCWQRADFLWACLHRLSVAEGADDYHYLISIDRKPAVDVQNVAYEFRNTSPLKTTIIHHADHPYRGNSYNTLTAYTRACAMTDKLVVLVEEDIFVSKGFFTFHERAHQQGKRFTVSACRDQNAPTPPIPSTHDARTVCYDRYRYQSLGVSFQADTVRYVLGAVAGSDYFEQMVETLARLFPNTSLPRGQAEQDGLFDRVLEELSHRDGTGMAYPIVPRAFHAGFVGSNRSNGRALTEGSVEDRGKRLLAMSQDEMNALADPSYRDIVRCDLELEEPETLSFFAI